MTLDWRREFAASARARASDVTAAAGLTVFIAIILGGVQLMPFGKGLLLVRVQADGRASALRDAAKADAAFVSIPASGFLVVYGKAAKVRAALGLAVPWKGKAPCSPRI